MKITGNQSILQRKTETTVSNFTYYLYLLYVISFFLHLTARMPSISALRPDLLLAALIIFTLVLQLNKLTGRFDNRCNRYLLIFFFYIILSTPFVEWPGSVLRENLAEFIKAFLFFHFTVLIIDTDLRLKRFVFVFMACQLVRVLEPLYLHEIYGYWGDATFLSGGGVVDEYTNRLGGAPTDVINSNGLGFVIATLFPFLHYLWGNSRWFLKIIYLTLIPTLLYTLVLTLSRSGMVATSVIIWRIFVKSRHKIVLIMVSIIIAILAWSNLNDIQKDRYFSLTGSTESRSAYTYQSRINGIKREFSIALQRPIVGHGVGTSKEAIFHAVGGSNVSHNLYLETFIETGIIGLIILLLFIKSVYETLKQTELNLSEPGEPNNNRSVPANNLYVYRKNLLLALTACFWMYLVFSIAQYGLSEYHWFMLAGVATVLNRQSLNNVKISSKKKQ